MTNEHAPEGTASETEIQPSEVVTETPAEAPNGKLLLGKRVLRHFGVRSDVQAGTYSVVGRCR